MTERDDDRDAVDPWAGDDDWAEAADDATGAAESNPGDASSDATDHGAGGDPDSDARSTATDTDSLGPRRYRVLDRTEGTLVFVDLDTPDPGPGPEPDEGFEPVRVAADDSADAVADAVAALEPGYVVTATLRWPDTAAGGDGGGDDTPLARVESLTVERESRYRFIDDAEPMFEAARDAWRDASAAGDGMGSRVTRDTDGEANGALYVFSEAGARDLFGEFRSGTTPLEPLVERVNDDLDDDPREVFVLRPPDGAFVAVYIAFERDGLLARTVRDTYR